jgi:hypothetical protein
MGSASKQPIANQPADSIERYFPQPENGFCIEANYGEPMHGFNRALFSYCIDIFSLVYIVSTVLEYSMSESIVLWLISTTPTSRPCFGRTFAEILCSQQHNRLRKPIGVHFAQFELNVVTCRFLLCFSCF